MSDLPKKNKHSSLQKEDPNLRGTLISVLLLGTFIAVSWFGVFAIFVSR
ncbi:cytochrome c oxidase subunit 2A [Virgibacillus ndiopensis]|nr:cytochrome c oxidase subunit 2A [Virgibacillus ndiopensis]